MAPVAVKITAARYGKDKVRIFRVVRQGKWHEVAEYMVTALLEGDIEPSYTVADNKCVVATDSIKNTVNIFAKTSPHVLVPELFALDLGIHFVTKYAHIHKAFVDVSQLRWTRIPVDDQPHPHSFTRDGNDTTWTKVVVDASKGKDALSASVKSGIEGLLVLKSSGSGFENFVRDEYTTLPEVSDRILSTSIDCSYNITLPPTIASESLPNIGIDFKAIGASARAITLKTFAVDESASVQATLYKMCEGIITDNKEVIDVSYSLPNKHYLAVDLSYFQGIKNLAPADAEVFCPVDAPSGLITATVARA